VDRYFDTDGQPGLAYGLVAGGELVHSGGRGVRAEGGDRPDLDTVFRIASMTKSFTAATLLSLRDAGALRLDDEVAEYVPEASALCPPTDDAPALTLRALLTMTAGLPTDDPWGDRQQDLPDDEFAALLRGGLTFAWTPGTAYEYSNLGYALLGRVITAAAGEPYPQVVRRRLLDPLGLTTTVFSADEVPPDRLAHGHRPLDGRWQEVPIAGHGAFAPMGGLFSSVRDLSRWVAGFTDAYPPRDGERAGGHPVRRSSRREQQQPHYGLPAVVTWPVITGPPTVRSFGYGFGLHVERDTVLGDLVGHSGGYPGFGSHMRWHPGSGVGVIVLANATYAPAFRLANQLIEDALRNRPRDRGPGASPAPNGSAMALATLLARNQVNDLIARWDDDLAARLLADNVDADEALPRRRAAIERYQESFGPLRADHNLSSTSPAHCSWWLRGPRGKVRVEIRLTPQSPPLVQSLTITPVPDAPAPLRDLAVRIGHALDQPEADRRGWLALGPEVDRVDLHRQFLLAAGWAGRSSPDDVLSGDGVREATFRLVGQHGSLTLSITHDPVTRVVSALTMAPLP